MLNKQNILQGVVVGVVAGVTILVVGSLFRTVGYMSMGGWGGMGSDRMSNMRGNMHISGHGKMMMNDEDMGGNMSMDEMMMDMTEGMKGKTGAELEQVFLEEMIVHHQGAIDMAKELLKGTKKAELVKMGNDIINVQTKEIEQMQTWLKSYAK